ncbi:transposable element Tcb1 transposase [Trichonephila clavipes]|nr:transposable element Tcb1 transposase [Trichonephila clavipes]
MGRSVSAETVRNVIRHAGYSSRVARKKPFISLQNQKERLEFAKTHQMKTNNFWKKVIFSDENKFNIFGSDGRRTVWRKPNTALDPKNLHPTVKHGGVSVMVWGRMASNGVGNLVFIDGIVNHKLYIDVLNNLKENAKKLGLDGNFIFQQDNYPKHTAQGVNSRFEFTPSRSEVVFLTLSGIRNSASLLAAAFAYLFARILAPDSVENRVSFSELISFACLRLHSLCT